MSKLNVYIMHYILILLFLNALVVDGAINYCGAKMCGYTNTHTFCRYPPGPGSTCMGYIDSKLSLDEQARVLARLNQRRSETARGIRALPTAGDMLKLRWVDELAREAQRWADQCRPPATSEEHDTCRDLFSISVGQCVASVVGEAPGLRPETMVDMWFMQSMNYNGNASSYIPPYKNNYGDFAQMIWSRTYMVGCGRSKFMIPWRDRRRTVERLVCNFAPRGPLPWGSLWFPAAPASSCPPRSRPDGDLPALCAFQHDMDETCDEDNLMAIEEHLLLNTIMLIEKNPSLHNIGEIDEIYLTKLAVATIDNSVLTRVPYSSIQKRDLVDKNKHEIARGEMDINKDLNNTESINDKSISITNKKTVKRKDTFVGRPKPYNLEELNGQKNYEAINDNIDASTNENEKNDETDDYKLLEIQDNTVFVNITSTETVHPAYDTTLSIINAGNIKDSTSPVETLVNSTSNILDLYIDEIVSNLKLSNALNETAIDENVIEEYLSNPATIRQIQESLKRMEYKLASPENVSGKVRRELRNVDQNHKKNQRVFSPEAERNKSIERGPMLNMMLKYVPYLKQYEKDIIGDASSKGTNVVYICLYTLSCNIVLLMIIV